LFARYIWIVNAIFRKIVYKNFVRHPEVSDYETNINVGYGFGLARTTDPLTQIIRVIRFCGFKRIPFGKNFSLLDLGCGDGFMIKGFDFVRFRNLSGVELDPDLANLASANIPRATIFCVDFSSSKFETLVGQNSYQAVFAFNPAPAQQLIPPLKKIAKNGSYILFLRNPKSWPELVAENDLTFEILGKPRNMVVARVTRNSDQN
jgi:hypothetical protein